MRGRLRFGFIVLVLGAFGVPAFGQGAAARPEEKTVAVFGQTIHYWDVGSGPVVVLVHGLGSRKEGDWGRVVAPLSQKYRVVALDQIGFGQSDKPLIDYRIQTYVDFLNEFLHQLKIEKVRLVGESLGGWICIRWRRRATRTWCQWKNWCWWMRRGCNRASPYRI
jgi:alpha-beta hydrolase superfamily lysophospholipase